MLSMLSVALIISSYALGISSISNFVSNDCFADITSILFNKLLYGYLLLSLLPIFNKFFFLIYLYNSFSNKVLPDPELPIITFKPVESDISLTLLLEIVVLAVLSITILSI